MTICSYAKVPETDSINAVTITPTLSFSGDTAECQLTVRAANVTDSVSATMKLWRGSTLLASWTGSGTWILNMSKTKTVTSGYTYKLTADVKINGVAQPTVSVTKYH